MARQMIFDLFTIVDDINRTHRLDDEDLKLIMELTFLETLKHEYEGTPFLFMLDEDRLLVGVDRVDIQEIVYESYLNYGDYFINMIEAIIRNTDSHDITIFDSLEYIQGLLFVDFRGFNDIKV